MKSFVLPISLLVGTVIGGGIFSLPFVFSQSGFITGIFYLLFFGVVSTFVHLIYADVIIRADNNHRFPGHAKMFLGHSGGIVANITIFISFTLTLLVYLILAVSFIGLIFPNLPEIIKILIFWAVGTTAIFFNIKRAAFFESITSFVTLLVIGIIFYFGAFAYFKELPQITLINTGSLFFPLGPILFSLIGISAIPPLIVYFKESGLKMSGVKKIIVWGTAITVLFYIAFIVGISGISNVVSEDAVSGLIGLAPKALLLIIGIFGFASLWDSYACVGTDIKKVLRHDWNLPKITADSIVIFLPLALYFFGLQSFIELISIVGGILFSIWGILLISIWQKASQKENQNYIIHKVNPAFIYILLIIFISTIIYQIKYIF